MKHLILLTFLTLLPFSLTKAENNDSITSLGNLKLKTSNTSWSNYNPERGFFQKAFTDPSDPRFMITNEDETFTFGIGGTFRMTTYYDICGAVAGEKFSTYNIPVPTEYRGRVGLSVESSNIYFKSKAKIGKHDLIAVVKIKSNTNEGIVLDKAYASYGGLTVGKVYSFFMDLAAGITTVDLQGPNTQIDHSVPLIGYTFDVGKHFTFGASIEKPAYTFPELSEYNITIGEDHQSMPDFVGKVVYRNTFGHLQAAGLFRNMNYKSSYSTIISHGVKEEHVRHNSVTGFGAALSGHINITRKSFASFQSFYGKGIADYVNDLENKYLSMHYVQLPIVGSTPKYSLEASPVWGTYVGYQYDFSKKFTMSAVYGFVKLYNNDSNFVYFDNTQYAALSGFYHINDWFMLGAEVLYGKHREYAHENIQTGEQTPARSGGACRADIMFSYTF